MGGVSITTKDSAGGIINPKQTWFKIDGSPATIVGCPIVPHGPGLHAGPKMAEGAPWFTIDGIPICRQGHKANCGHPTTGHAWFDIA
jgi:uncharacterized Zn-binding protein involved in type VI secretion